MDVVLKRHYKHFHVLCEEVFKLKSTGSDMANSKEFADKRRRALLLFVLIKKANRSVKYTERAGRDKLHAEKINVDSNRLLLQNLLYEVNHLKREVRYCHKFKSQDEDIDLMAESEYLKLVPNASTDLPQSKHKKRLRCLELEFSLRKQLATSCNEYVNQKRQIVQNIVSQMERFASFGPALRQLTKATQPLQAALQLPLDIDWKFGQLVELLPSPLYLVYMNIHALERTSKYDVKVVVIGSADKVMLSESSTHLETLIENNLSKANTTIDEESMDIEEEKSKLIEPFPLAVQFTVGNSSQPNEHLTITLRFFSRLGLVTAISEVCLSENDNAVGDTALTQDVLNNLYDNDLGDIIPVAGTESELQKVHLSSNDCLASLRNEGYGRPYFWLQRMCSIQTFNQIETKNDNNSKLQRIIPDTIKDIQQLWNSRLNLIKQIKALVNKNIDMYLREEKLPDSKLSCSLVQWTSVDWEEYSTNSYTQPYMESNMVDANHCIYRAVVVRGSAKMECLISISPTFPVCNPLWVINIFWNGHHNASNCSAVKLMEHWTNSLTQDQVKSSLALLSMQLIRTMHSFDIYLETEGPLFNPIEFSRDKQFLRAFTKRFRARPYKYVDNIHSFLVQS